MIVIVRHLPLIPGSIEESVDIGTFGKQKAQLSKGYGIRGTIQGLLIETLQRIHAANSVQLIHIVLLTKHRSAIKSQYQHPAPMQRNIARQVRPQTVSARAHFQALVQRLVGLGILDDFAMPHTAVNQKRHTLTRIINIIQLSDIEFNTIHRLVVIHQSRRR